MAKKKFTKRQKQTAVDVDDSLVVESNLNLNFNIKQKFILTPKQKSFVELVLAPTTNILFCEGPAGTSKTYLALYTALRMLKEKRVNDILYIRSIVESAHKKIGSLPGEVGEKFKPWVQPLLEKADELVGVHVANDLMSEGTIKCTPVNFLRGSTFSNCFVIVDESQNLEMSELITIISRFGTNCKLLLLGDPMQSDIKSNSFETLSRLFEGTDSAERGINTFKFTEDDIMRSQLLRFIIQKLRTLK